jgi:nitrate reductase NapAB chaperone NapD
MQISTALSAIGNLLALIQASNPKFSVITEDLLAVQSVSVQAPEEAGNNAVVVVAASGYTDTASFTYKQLSLTDAAGQSTFSIAPQAGAQAADIVAAVAASYGLLASELMLTNEDSAVAGGSVATVAVVPGSLIYAPSTIAVALTWPVPAPSPEPAPAPVAPSITSLVDNAVLGGFEAATPAAPATDPAAAPAADATTPVADTTTATDAPVASDASDAAQADAPVAAN